MTTKAAPTALPVERLRADFPALGEPRDGRRLVYLDSACTALKSRAVAAATAEFYERLGACGGKRSTHRLAQEVEAVARTARHAAAEFLGAGSDNEIVFTSGTTEAANIVARGFPYDEVRREVVITDLEHNAVFLPFFEAEQRGEIELKYLRTKDGRIDPEALDRLIGPRTALVALTRASNVAGGAQPMAELCRLVRRQGASVFSDCAQYVATHREDVAATNVDFAAFSAHKIGGPFGLGALYGKEQWLNRLRPWKVGGGTVKSVTWTGANPEVGYLDAPQRFEAGVQNYGAFPGLHEAIKWQMAIPEASLRSHIGGLVRRAVSGLARFSQIRVLGRPEDLEGGALVSFYPVHPEFSVHDFNLFLNHELKRHFIAVRAGEHCAHLLHRSYGIPATVRASFFAYTTMEEVDLFLDAVGDYVAAACS